MKAFTLILITFLATKAVAQFNAPERVAQLKELLDTLRAAKTDESKELANQNFDKQLEFTLNEPTVFDIDFSSLKSLGVIDSPDNLVRIVTWNTEYADDIQSYNGYVISRAAIGKEPHVVKLNYFRDVYNPKPTEIVDENQWYGALYYQIVPFTKGSKTTYILLGWNGGGANSNIKLIDAMNFTSDGVKFGQSIFKTKEQTYKRFFLEHSSKSVISLRYEPQYERIIFDHLSPETPSMKGFYEYYVPDMSYDAFTFGNAKLILEEDVIGISKTAKKIKKGNTIDPETGEIVMKDEKNVWIDPTSENGISPETHVAVTPDQVKNKNVDKDPDTKTNSEKKTAQEIYDEKKRHKKEKPSNSILNEPGKKRKK